MDIQLLVDAILLLKKNSLTAQFFKNEDNTLEVLTNVELTHKVHKHYKAFNNQNKKNRRF